MASVSGDYDEDWEEAEPSVAKENVISVAGLGGHSMENDTRDAEPTQVPVPGDPAAYNPETPVVPSKVSDNGFKSVELKAKATENATNDTSTWVRSEEVPTSEDTLSSAEGKELISKVQTADTSPGDSSELVQGKQEKKSSTPCSSDSRQALQPRYPASCSIPGFRDYAYQPERSQITIKT